MKCVKIVLLLSVLIGAASAQLDTTSQDYYMYLYFYNSQEAAGARLAFSTDLVNWELYNNEQPIIVPNIAKGATPLMRDPNCYYDSSTGVFHLVWTTAWEQDNIGYATSKDLINWSDQLMIEVGTRIENTFCCWAPEFYYDDLKDSIMVLWSTERGEIGKEAFYCMTKDFKHFTKPQVYFAPRNFYGEVYNVIDGTILKVEENKYYLFFKDERAPGEAGQISKNIHYVFGPTPQGPWWKGPVQDVSRGLTYAGTEGPFAIILGDEVRLYFDPYDSPELTGRMVSAKLSDLQGEGPPPDDAFGKLSDKPWDKTPVMKTMAGDNFLPSHGSIYKIPRAKVMQTLYGQPDPTVYPKSFTMHTQEDIFVDSISGGTTTDTCDTCDVEKVYPVGKRNCGLGSGVGLAFFPPIVIRAMAFRRRKKRKVSKDA